jgi:hypothetical protein
MPMTQCYHCQQEFLENLRVERSSECPQCRRDIRVCRNCRHYSPNAHWDCRETIPEAVIDKERRNFCEHFALKSNSNSPSNPARAREQKARSQFDALFKNDTAD